MNLVRCEQCGEVAEAAGQRNCPGCDHPLPAVPATRPPPRRIPPTQREARSDLSASKAIMIGLLGGGAVGLTFIFLRESGSMGQIALPLIGAAVVAAVLIYRKDRRKASPVAAAPEVPERLSDAPPVPYRSNQLDNGCVAVLTVLGVIGAVIAGGFVVFFIVCMRSFDQLF